MRQTEIDTFLEMMVAERGAGPFRDRGRRAGAHPGPRTRLKQTVR